MRELAGAKEVKPILGADPDVAVAAGVQRADAVVRQGERRIGPGSLPGGEPVVLPAQQTAPLRADPQSAVSAFRQCHTVVVGQGRRVGSGENVKVPAVEADQTGAGANPQVAVASLEQTADIVLREAVVGSPASDSIGLHPGTSRRGRLDSQRPEHANEGQTCNKRLLEQAAEHGLQDAQHAVLRQPVLRRSRPSVELSREIARHWMSAACRQKAGANSPAAHHIVAIRVALHTSGVLKGVTTGWNLSCAHRDF